MRPLSIPQTSQLFSPENFPFSTWPSVIHEISTAAMHGHVLISCPTSSCKVHFKTHSTTFNCASLGYCTW